MVTLLPDPMTVVTEVLSLVFGVIASKDFLRILIFPGFLNVALVAAFLTWFERKLLARVQLRVGPLYAGGAMVGGLLQPIADGVKLIFKEIIFPSKADKPLFVLIPLIMVIVGATPFAVIPFGERWVIANLAVGLPFVFAALSLFPAMVLLVGWASNSKYPFLGGVRALFQQVAYEVPMWISVLGIVILSGSLSLVDIVKAQSLVPFVVPQALGFVVFVIAILAELERIPFDLPEAEPELVMGWLTEMSGAIFMLSFLGLYTKLYMMSTLVAVLFLGGWMGPAFIPLVDLTPVTGAISTALGFLGPAASILSFRVVLDLNQPLWTLVKAFVVASFLVLVRGVYPRVRVDLLLKVGWTRLLLVALVNLAVTLALVSIGVADLWRVRP